MEIYEGKTKSDKVIFTEDGKHDKEVIIINPEDIIESIITEDNTWKLTIKLK